MTIRSRVSITVMCCCMMWSGTSLLGTEPTKPCTKDDYLRANAASLTNWSEVYQSYKQFGHCDQGGLGEIYSDAVAKLLSERWNTTDQLNRLASQSGGFRQFVLRHIDELMTPQQASIIRNNTQTRCPPDAKRLCNNIRMRIDKAAISTRPDPSDGPR